MHVANDRWIQDPEGYLLYKVTYYWIEVKVESPGTEGYADFGGKTPEIASREDCVKLANQKAVDSVGASDSFDIVNRRYWYTMLAFSDKRRAYCKSMTFPWTISREYMHPTGSMWVGLREL